MSPSITVLGKPRPAFQICGYSGLLLAIVQSSVLIAAMGLSQLTLLGMTGVVILTFLALIMTTKVIVGEELIIYYHHEIAVIVTVTVFLRVTGQPVLPYLDVTVLGLGLFLACGRLGCLMVGCCHGRPWRWGVVYGDAHAAAGFPGYFIGVRLFPIQAVEAVFAALLVAAGVTAIVNGYPPGTAFASYVLLYAAGRFCFEFARGDAVRPYLWGFSEAQWTSVIVALAETWAEYASVIPSYSWHLAVPFLLLVAIPIVTLKRRRERLSRFEVLHARHIREVAEAVQLLETLDPSRLIADSGVVVGLNVMHVANTSLGVSISAGDVNHGARRIRHYSVSHDAAPLTRSSAVLLATTISRVHHAARPFALVPGESGVFHVVFDCDASIQAVKAATGASVRE